MTRTIILTVALIGVGTGSASFLLALFETFEPEQIGFFHRWLIFSWRYCLPVGVISAAIFLFAYRHQIFR